MAKALLAILLASATATAQTAPAPAPKPAAPQPAPEAAKPAPAGETGGKPEDAEALRREFERKLEEVRRETRAQIAAQTAASGWEDGWTEEKRKLELFELDGYFRFRPVLLHKLDLNRDPDPSGNTLFFRSPTSNVDRTLAGVDMRARLLPTLNVSEDIRVRMMVDALDNVVWGSTPEFAFSRAGYQEFEIFGEGQAPPRSGINSVQDSLAVKRLFGEVRTPVGLLRFGRTGSHWGLGVLRNDGDCLDCDYGDDVDRVMLVTEPLRGSGIYVTPMLEFYSEGPTTEMVGDPRPPVDFSNTDDAHGYVLVLAKRDLPLQEKTKLENDQSVFNYGLFFTYKVQRNSFVDYLTGPFQGGGGDVANTLPGAYVPRAASLYIPDVWVKFERKLFRIELEVAAIIGRIENRALQAGRATDPAGNQALSVLQLGGALQSEVRLLNGDLKLGLEVGGASGDRAFGMGSRPGRRVAGADNNTQRGDIDGPQYACQSTGGCTDNAIRNFRFNRAYRIDTILWREILGTVTDAVYFKPNLDYRIAEGFNIFGSVIYSRAIYRTSTPAANAADLGVEINAGAHFETDDGLFARITWALLFPLGGLRNTGVQDPAELENAQALRGLVGIKF